MNKSGKSVRFFVVLFFTLLLFKACEPESSVSRDELIGTWTCTETGSSNATFNVTISASSASANSIKIYNFNHLGSNLFVEAEINGSSITIFNQEVDGWQISGSGTITNADALRMNYSIYDGAETEHVSATFTR